MVKVCTAVPPAPHEVPDSSPKHHCSATDEHCTVTDFALPDLSGLCSVSVTLYSCVADKLASALQNTSDVIQTWCDVTHALSPTPRMILQRAVCSVYSQTWRILCLVGKKKKSWYNFLISFLSPCLTYMSCLYWLALIQNPQPYIAICKPLNWPGVTVPNTKKSWLKISFQWCHLAQEYHQR